MMPAEYECPECGDPAVLLSPDPNGVTLASCQGCGRPHGRWAELQAAAAEAVAKRPVFASRFLKGAR